MVASLWALDATTNLANKRACLYSPSLLQRTFFTHSCGQNKFTEEILLKELFNCDAAVRQVFHNAGNLTTKWNEGSTPFTATYDAVIRLVTQFQGASLYTFSYDANGNQILEWGGGVRTTLVYDCENRLLSLTAGAALSTYTYNGDGLRRTAHQSGGILTTFVWGGDDYLQERT